MTSPGKGPIAFLQLVGKLKHVRRSGWIRSGVGPGRAPGEVVPRFTPSPPTSGHLGSQRIESVSDHMHRMSVMALLMAWAPSSAQALVDRDKCIRMALVHDIAESIAGDITPHDGVSNEDKHQLELDALITLGNSLGEEYQDAFSEILSLWNEYEAGESPEAILVKDLDKLEMLYAIPLGCIATPPPPAPGPR
ncbi:hypothetical protein H696_04335 [Fonticula alba]|uniref:5'-deoxynucleotidase n=1 Tax=Fonticula alba TaxID=691883 RepID=A0A058Z3Q2_FONAL|nr:hypothetical protein H696_04335 [Fonticula alba]KCV68914.1 hypothetical protein H696_04335 [Fonticula alba]|eukprot:XP_009496485.1 hypothetical protein H696_04335 [Fonticula alba]